MKSLFRLACLVLNLVLFQKLVAQHKSDAKAILEQLTPKVENLMTARKLAGLSVAVIDNHKIVWTNTYGVKENGTYNKIEENTAYSTASISKAITATTCFILEEQGKIDTDAPIRNYLKRWQLPESKYLTKTDLTIKHLLSHTGGTSHDGYADFYGNDEVPTLVDVLNGEGLPNHDKGIDILFESGTAAEYSGGGYVIIQMAIEDILGRLFQDIVKELIFDPLQMYNSTMIQPNQEGFLTNVAKVHNVEQNVIRTGLPICPQLGPSGMWSTAKDLALLALETQNAINGKNTKVISTSAARKLSDIVTYKFAGGGALGWQRSYAYGNLDWLTVGGSNAGVGGEVNSSMKGGKGIVMLANGDNKNRLPVFNFLRSQIIEQLHWGQKISNKTISLDKKLINALTGSYLDFMYGDFSEIVTITESNRDIYITSQILKLFTGSDKNRMYHQGNGVFKIEEYPNLVAFKTENNILKAVTIYRQQNDKRQWRVPIEVLKTMKVKLLDAFSDKDFNTNKAQYKILKSENPEYNFSNSLVAIGVAFYSRNELVKALKVFEFNAEENPNNPTSFLALAEITERIGNIEAALQYYKKALTFIENEEDRQELKAKIEQLNKN